MMLVLVSDDRHWGRYYMELLRYGCARLLIVLSAAWTLRENDNDSDDRTTTCQHSLAKGHA